MATQHPRACPTKRLASAITATATSLTLNNITDWDGNDWTTSTFDSSTSYPVVLRNEANTQYELIECDTLTLSGTTMDITKRALGYDGTTVTGTETAYDWNANETLVEFGSNPPQLYEQYADKIADETIGGIWTFSQTPITNTTPVSSSNIANKAYVDSVAGGVAITNQVTINDSLGQDVSQGNILYFSSSDQLWYKADADLTSSFQNKTLGIAMTSGANTSSINILTQGYSTAVSTSMTAGTKYFLSNTAGGIDTTGTYEVYLGYGLSATKFLFEPRRDDIPFAYEKDALAGLAIGATAPSGSNQYLTLSDSSGTGYLVRMDKINYGGTSTGGALSIGTTGTLTSGTVSYDCSGNSVVVLDYTSISITSGGGIAFTNPSSGGTMIVMKSYGDVLLESTTPAINLTGLGCEGSSGSLGASAQASDADYLFSSGHGGGAVSSATAGNGGIVFPPTAKSFYAVTDRAFNGRSIYLACGCGGSAGAGANNAGTEGGAGGNGGGALYLECGGALNFSGQVWCKGNDGSSGSANAGGGGGGGGGAGGMALFTYRSLTANTGTINLSGGSGGKGGSALGGGTAGAGGGGGGNYYSSGASGSSGNTGISTSATSAGGAGSNGSGGGGSGGHGTVGAPTGDGGAGGSLSSGLVTKNNVWS